MDMKSAAANPTTSMTREFAELTKVVRARLAG
jgi:hypothetical protein